MSHDPEADRIAAKLAETVKETAEKLAEVEAKKFTVDKDALKEALKEWMDEKYATLGKWSAASIAVAALGALVWVILVTSGWKPPV
jgi:predicted neutral ceramidase superfamily lipid hydrolase